MLSRALSHVAQSPFHIWARQTEEEQKVCRIYRKLLVDTFIYAAEILPLCLADPTGKAEAAAEAKAVAAAKEAEMRRVGLYWTGRQVTPEARHPPPNTPLSSSSAPPWRF